MTQTNQLNNEHPRPDNAYNQLIGAELQRGVDPRDLFEMGYDNVVVRSLIHTMGRLTSSEELMTSVDPVFPEREQKTTEIKPSNLERFRDRFSWTPRYEREVTLAVKGMEHNLRSAVPIQGVETTIDEIHGYSRAAIHAQHILRSGCTDYNELSTISADLIREHIDEEGVRDILEAISTELLFKEGVVAEKEPWAILGKNGRVGKTRLLPFIKKVKLANDEQLLEMWKDTFNSQGQRAKFWVKTAEGMTSHPRVEMVKAEQRDPSRGHYRT
jgi:hypothetical protein